MAKPLLTIALWQTIETLLPTERPNPRDGRAQVVTNRAALTGIVFVLWAGIPGCC
jgi:hypothetical protein